MVYFGRRDPLLAISEIAVPFAAHLFPAGTFCCARMVRGLSLCGISYVRNLGGLEIMMKTCCDLYSPFVAQIRGKSSRSYWRTATSLILAAKRELSVPYKSQLAPTGKLDRGDYDVLMLTRSKKSAFMSERVVFPGGVLDEEDFHENWKDIFEKCTSKEFGELESAFTIPGIRPPVILSHCEGCLSPDIAFRIGAIRETFEETGILLVKSKSELAPGGVFLDKMSNLVVKPQDILKSAELKSWRDRVREHPAEFQKLCKELEIVPDVWALKEWANWLTPAMQTEAEPPAKPHRFDAMFYLCCMNGTPLARADQREVSSPTWSSPANFLWLSKNLASPGCTHIRLADPQIYELSRLSGYGILQQLCHFASSREPKGIHCMVSAVVLCADGRVHALTGDDFHPEEMDPTKSTLLTSSKTIDELRAQVTQLNRIEWRNSEGSTAFTPDSRHTLRCNVVPAGHVAPLADTSL